MTKKTPNCARCGLKTNERACYTEEGRGPAFCPTENNKNAIERANQNYKEPDILEFARQASIQEGSGYGFKEVKPYILHPVKPRIQEICEFAWRMGYNKLGIAFCIGLINEAALLADILEQQGFETVSAVCKTGRTPKEFIGLADEEKVYTGCFESMCNPIAQAELLNESGTEFNIALGLCVGHDSLFFKYSKAMTTVFAVKDRVLGHNPIAALYTSKSYYRRYLTKINTDSKK